jgi:hypothetical protein
MKVGVSKRICIERGAVCLLNENRIVKTYLACYFI